MRKFLLTAGALAALATPAIAAAQQTCEQQSTNRVVGTVGGAGIGALLGSAIAGRGDRTTGAIIGGVGGAVIGNQATKPNADCAHAYGYYDRGNVWHANDVRADQARGYYDRDGRWIDGTPNGYYDTNGRWIAGSGDAQRAGYRDEHGHWIPAGANSYYDADNRNVNGAVSGYYGRDGRWNAGVTVGRYDNDGRWMAGQPSGHRDSEGRWIADPQPGYYDNSGQWRRGQAVGYYDNRGGWVSTGQAQAGYGDNDGGHDLASRENRIQQRIAADYAERTLSRRDRDRALRELDSIRRTEHRMTDRSGHLSASVEQDLQARLDNLRDMLRSARNG